MMGRRRSAFVPLVTTLVAAMIAVAAVLAAPVPFEPVGPPPAQGCWAVNGKYGVACACTEQYCDFPEPLTPLGADEVALYASVGADATKRLNREPLLTLSDSNSGAAFQISLDLSTRLQSIMGFGGALTDAAAFNFYQMTEGVQKAIIDQYYSAGGIGYTYARTHMGSCDFSTHVYSYADTPGDFNLSSFTVEMDEESGKLPLIRLARDAVAAASPSGTGSLRLFATAWSPPAWMKTNSNQTGGALRPADEYHRTWALYFSRFITAYAERGVDVWAVTPGNEPLGLVWWDSCSWSMEGERDFIGTHLGPVLRADHPTVQLMMGDDQRDTLPQFAAAVLGNATAAQYVDGIAFHWYSEEEDVFSAWDKLQATHSAYPNVFLLPTEACEGYLPFPFDEGPHLGEWSRGLTYAHDVLGDLQNWAAGWIDWNIVLDLEGGPNHARNWVDAPFLCDTANGTLCYKQPLFYALGHFATFLPAGAQRVALNSTSSDKLEPPLEATAFVVPARGATPSQVVVVVLNRDELLGRQFTVSLGTGKFLNTNIEPAAIHTYIFDLPTAARA